MTPPKYLTPWSRSCSETKYAIKITVELNRLSPDHCYGDIVHVISELERRKKSLNLRKILPKSFHQPSLPWSTVWYVWSKIRWRKSSPSLHHKNWCYGLFGVSYLLLHYYSYLLLRWITLRRQLHSLLPEVIPNPRTRWIRVLLLSTASNYQSSAPLLPLTMNATMYQPSSVSVSIKNATPASTNNNGPIEKKPRGDRGPRGGIYDPFPLKFHRVLDEIKHEGMDSIVSWVSHGRAFKIHNPSMFVTDVMPRFFSQSKYTSFQRQLNLYGETSVVWSSTMLLCHV